MTAFLAASTAVGFTIYAQALKAEADSLLQDIFRLKVGVSPQADVDRLIERHKSYLKLTECKPESCPYFFEVRNKWLSFAGIEPATRFQAWMMVASGSVQSFHAELSRETRIFPTASSGGIVDEYVNYPEYYRPVEMHYGFPTPVGKPYLSVVLDSRATAEQRRRAYAFSLTCLVKPGGGCDLPCDYLPLAWKDWEAELKSAGWGFGAYYPNRARCKSVTS